MADQWMTGWLRRVCRRGGGGARWAVPTEGAEVSRALMASRRSQISSTVWGRSSGCLARLC